MRMLVVLGMLVLAGCTTVHEWGNGRVAVPRVVEVRSPFGTNAGFVMVEDCEGHVKTEDGLQPLFPETVYTDCHAMTGWVPMSSQGQGGQVASGLLQFGGLIGMGALMPASQTTVNGVSATPNVSAASSAGGGPASTIINGGIHHK